MADESETFSKPMEANSNCIGDVSFTTFNILAPIYKRLNGEEFWIGNEELVGMYEYRLSDAGYATYKLARTNNRGDGLLTAVHRNHFRVLNYKELLFNDFCDRVAQLLHVELIMNFSQNKIVNVEKEAVIVNTHLLFPHNSRYCFPRLQQVYKILQYIESYCEEYQLPPVPIILCGDWNGSKMGHVYKFLRSQGFVSSYDIAHHYTKWVSHRNHRGNICGVDFIWLYNPNNHRRPLKESFMEAILGNIKNHLQDHGSYITYSQFLHAFSQLGLTSHPFNILSAEEVKELWDHVDTNGDGVIEFSLLNLQSAGNSQAFSQQKGSSDESKHRGTRGIMSNNSTTIGFKIKNAVLFPPEVKEGLWPENYSLSDHANLTVEFSPVTMQSTKQFASRINKSEETSTRNRIWKQ